MNSQYLRRPLALGLAVLLFAAGCTTVPGTGRRQLSFIPAETLALAANDQFQQMKQDMKVSTDPAANAQVRRVGERIAAVVGDHMPGGAQWEFVVFDDPQVNAFAMPGGKVGVFTGLLHLVDSDDELATVMGHEVAHVTSNHGGERASQAMVAQGGGLALGLALNESSPMTQQLAMTAYGLGSQVFGLLPYGRLQESEADEVGIRYAARAGYDPRAAVTFWEKMAAQDRAGRPPQFLSTHPNPENRIAKIQEMMPELLVLYRQAGGTP